MFYSSTRLEQLHIQNDCYFWTLVQARGPKIPHNISESTVSKYSWDTELTVSVKICSGYEHMYSIMFYMEQDLSV